MFKVPKNTLLNKLLRAFNEVVQWKSKEQTTVVDLVRANVVEERNISVSGRA